MTQRINITLPADVLVAIDEAAAREHLTRSGFLRAAALERLGSGPGVGTGAGVVRESPAVYAPERPSVVDPSSSDHTWPPSREAVAALLSAFFTARDDVEVAYLFGSVARGDARPTSDVDIAVLVDGSLSAEQRWALRVDLIGRLSMVLGTDDLDVILLDEVGAGLALDVIDGGLIIAGAHRAARHEFESSLRERTEHQRATDEGRRRSVRERIVSGGFFDANA